MHGFNSYFPRTDTPTTAVCPKLLVQHPLAGDVGGNLLLYYSTSCQTRCGEKRQWGSVRTRHSSNRVRRSQAPSRKDDQSRSYYDEQQRAMLGFELSMPPASESIYVEDA